VLRWVYRVGSGGTAGTGAGIDACKARVGRPASMHADTSTMEGSAPVTLTGAESRLVSE
jgi:hypothetical protein